jgi:hypothetical protein
MSTKSREVIFGSRIRGAKIHPQGAREAARKAACEADRAEAEARAIRMEGYGGPAQPSPTIRQCLNGGHGWLEVMCKRCETRASIPLDALRRPRNTPIWKLEAALKCRSCKRGRYAPPVQMIELTETHEITLYLWVHPDDERRGRRFRPAGFSLKMAVRLPCSDRMRMKQKRPPTEAASSKWQEIINHHQWP